MGKKKEKTDAKSVSTKTLKQNPGKVKDFCNINLVDLEDGDSTIDTGIILSLSGEPKKAVINVSGEYTEVTWWGEGGDPAKDGQIDTGKTAMGMLQINTTTYNEIGDHSVSFEVASRGKMYRNGVKFTVVP